MEKFTIIIPTRERADTLYSAIKTCVAQDYDNLVILVSDNYSQDNTRDVVSSFDDKRIQYINTGKRVSMSSNWEFALSHVDDGYVYFLGDDDGMMPNAIRDISKIFSRFQVDAVSWHRVSYTWPNLLVHPNKMLVPIRKDLVLTQGKALLKSLIRSIKLPRGLSIYNAFVATKIISRIRKKTGRFFNSVNPDVYSSFAILGDLDTFIHSERPFSVSGHGVRSNSYLTSIPYHQYLNAANTDLCSLTDRKFGDNFFEEADLPIHDSMPLITGSTTSCVCEAILQANEHCFDNKYKVSLRRAIWKITRELARRDANMYQVGIQQLDGLTRRIGLRTFFRVCRAIHPNRPSADSPFSMDGPRLGYLIVESLNDLGVEDVLSAANFAYKLLGPFSCPERLQVLRWYHRYTGVVHRKLARYLDVR